MDNIPLRLKVLRELTGDQPQTQRLLDTVEPLIVQKMALLQKRISWLERGDREAAIRSIRSGEGLKLMQNIRTVTTAINAEEDRLLAVRQAAAQVSNRNALLTLLIGTCISLGLLLLLLFSCLKREITRRRRTEEKLSQSEEEFRAVLNNMPTVVFTGYLDGSVDFFDDKVGTLTGYPREDFDSRRRKWTDLILAEDKGIAKQVFIKALKNFGSYVREYRISTKEGEVIWIQERSQITFDQEGQADSVSGVFFDITARKQGEEAARESEKNTPKAEEVMSGAEIYRREVCNLIVAVGGGSPIDCAKGIGIVSSHDKHILEFEGVDQVPLPGPPLICIPTTAGTSTDVSQFAIITDIQRRVKIAIISKTVGPDESLIDPVTTTTMDALVHAIEAFVYTASSVITDLHALEAIRLVKTYLFAVLASPDNIELRGKMMLASLHAGLAFSNASLGAVHAMVHSLGGFLGLPHGEANALLLDHVMAFNFEIVPERYRLIGKAMGLDLDEVPLHQVRTAILAEVGSLRQGAGVCHTLGQLGVRRDDIPELSAKAMEDACMVTNPRPATSRDIGRIYEEAL